jgi:F0F1-type ATP synthase delta subunit
MKTINEYNEQLENILMMFDDDKLMEWFKSNSLNEKDLLELIIRDNIETEV